MNRLITRITNHNSLLVPQNILIPPLLMKFYYALYYPQLKLMDVHYHR